jgi:hypothetical protein
VSLDHISATAAFVTWRKERVWDVGARHFSSLICDVCLLIFLFHFLSRNLIRVTHLKNSRVKSDTHCCLKILNRKPDRF